MQIGINEFALRRHTTDSRFSHFGRGWDTLVELALEHFEQGKQGNRDGILMVPVPADGFLTGVVEVTPETELVATFAARREGEEPYISVSAVGGDKLPAKCVELVLYRRDVLGNDATTTADWEIVSINARATEEPEPPTPMAMARNQLGLPGGTPAQYTADEFARAIMYWSKRAMRA